MSQIPGRSIFSGSRADSPCRIANAKRTTANWMRAEFWSPGSAAFSAYELAKLNLDNNSTPVLIRCQRLFARTT
jgi:hypothetical protein